MIMTDILNYLLTNPGLVIALFLLYCFIYALSILFSGPKPGRNPFATRHVRPPPALVTDHTDRNKVIKYSESVYF